MLSIKKIKRLISKLPLFKEVNRFRYVKRHLNNQKLQTALALEYLLKAQLGLLKHTVVLKSRKEIDAIVSLTSYGERLASVHHVVLVLLTQSVKVKKIILWVAESDKLLVEKNRFLTKLLEQRCLEINYCSDLRSYKKLIPCLTRFPKDVIITVDDDVIYPPDLLEKLFTTHLQFPTEIIAGRAHQITFNQNGEINPYNSWNFDSRLSGVRKDLIPIGIGGVLYPVNSLNKRVLDKNAFMKLAPSCDDLWFKVMSVINKRAVKVVDSPLGYCDYLHLPQIKSGLYDMNVVENDRQLIKLINAYPEFIKELKE